MEYVNGDPARITTEGNDPNQQTAPHNHAVDVVDTQCQQFIADTMSMSLTSHVGHPLEVTMVQTDEFQHLSLSNSIRNVHTRNSCSAGFLVP